MSHRQRLLTATLLAALVSVFGASAASAQEDQAPADDTEQPSPVPAAPLENAPADVPPEVEVIHSWALGPAGSADPAEAGNRSTLSYTADPGATINDAVTLYNLGNVPLTFRIYSTDAFNDAEGNLALLAGDEQPTQIGSWVDLDTEEITLDAGLQATIPIVVNVPDDARPGDHTGAIIASSEAQGTGEGGDTVVLDRRTGTRLLLRVNGPITADLAVTDLQTSYEPSINPLGGAATVNYRVENRGNVRLAGTSEVSVSGLFGLGGKKLPPVEIPELLPGEGLDFRVAVDDVPAFGWSTAEVALTAISSGGGVEGETSTSSASAFAPPVALLLFMLLALLLWIAVRATRRHRNRNQPEVLVVEPPTGFEREPQHS
ncbi:MAG: hypothetical protein AAFY28_08250 [Actinomycetota bacterium]